MNQKLLKDWIFALRSGMYKQGRGWRGWSTPGADHCALSVLVESQKFKDFEGEYVKIAKVLGISPRDVAEIFYMNDQLHPKSFTEIADYLEKTYLKEEVSHEPRESQTIKG